jgi:carbonic anhydrase
MSSGTIGWRGAAALACLSVAAVAAAQESHWAYGAEVAEWGSHYPACRGERQSPIALDTLVRPGSDVGRSPIMFGIHGVGGRIRDFRYGPIPLRIENNGHTIEVHGPATNRYGFVAGMDDYRLADGSVVTAAPRYEFVRVHFHTPAEHIFYQANPPARPSQDLAAPMEAHLVHTGPLGTAVIGVLFVPGAANPFIEQVLAHAPGPHQEREVEGVEVDLRQLLPADLGLYRYWGSLTTPPCSEGVNWHLMMQPMTASPEQLRRVRELMGANARPIQRWTDADVVAN